MIDMNKEELLLYSKTKVNSIDNNNKVVLMLDEKSEHLIEKTFDYQYDDQRNLHISYILDYRQNPEQILKNKYILSKIFENFDSIQKSIVSFYKNQDQCQSRTEFYKTFIFDQLNDQKTENNYYAPIIFLPFLNTENEKEIIEYTKNNLYNLVIFDFIKYGIVENDFLFKKSYKLEELKDYNPNFQKFIEKMK